jgi:hypothetical protein
MSASLGDLALTTRVAIRGGGIADPRILGEPFVWHATQWTKRAAEEYGGGVEGCVVSLYVGGNGPSRLGAEDHHYTHLAAPPLALAPIGVQCLCERNVKSW